MEINLWNFIIFKSRNIFFKISNFGNFCFLNSIPYPRKMQRNYTLLIINLVLFLVFLLIIKTKPPHPWKSFRHTTSFESASHFVWLMGQMSSLFMDEKIELHSFSVASPAFLAEWLDQFKTSYSQFSGFSTAMLLAGQATAKQLHKLRCISNNLEHYLTLKSSPRFEVFLWWNF